MCDITPGKHPLGFPMPLTRAPTIGREDADAGCPRRLHQLLLLVKRLSTSECSVHLPHIRGMDCERLLSLDGLHKRWDPLGREAAGLSGRATTQSAGRTFHPSASSIMVCSPICKARGQESSGYFAWQTGDGCEATRKKRQLSWSQVGPAQKQVQDARHLSPILGKSLQPWRAFRMRRRLLVVPRAGMQDSSSRYNACASHLIEMKNRAVEPFDNGIRGLAALRPEEHQGYAQ